jgi:DNA-binding MarR family transcriptional regulator
VAPSPRDSIDAHVEHWAKELPGLDPIHEAIVGRLHLLGRYLASNRTEALSSDGLVKWQFKTLLMLRRVGEPYEASPSQLADLLGLTRGAPSARLGTLEELGLISRTHHRYDRRRVTVRLTSAGNRALESMIGQEEAGETRLFSGLTDQEKDTLAGLLRKLVLTIETPGDPPDESRLRQARGRFLG